MPESQGAFSFQSTNRYRTKLTKRYRRHSVLWHAREKRFHHVWLVWIREAFIVQ